MGREDKATWKSNYFTKLVVSNFYNLFLIQAFINYDEYFSSLTCPRFMLELEIAEPTSMWGLTGDAFF